MSAMRRVVDGEGARKGDLAAIHIAKAALRLDEDSYRDLMATVCGGIRSAGQLDFTGRKRFLAHLQACLKAQGIPAPKAARRVVQAPLSPTQKKMWALWMQLADAGLIQSRSMQALVAFVHRQTGVDRLEWLNNDQERLVIDSMRAWLKSRGEEPR